MTTEELQKTWQESGRIGSPYNPRMNSRRETALEKLGREYRRFSMVALIMTIASLFFFNFPWLEMPWKVVIPVLFISFFATASTMDHWLANGIRSIDCSRMSVREVIDRSLFYRRRHHQFRWTASCRTGDRHPQIHGLHGLLPRHRIGQGIKP